MSRFPSLRSIWTTASSGILFATIVACCCLSTPAFSQKADEEALNNYAGYDDEPSRGGLGSSMGGQGGERVTTISNIASGVSRPDNYSSINAVQALLYPDTVGIFHYNFAKIDYEGLSAFFDEIVDKGAGSVRSDDKYRVQLREYQKSELKSSFKGFLSTLQNVIVKNSFQNNVDEFYIIEYASNDDKVLGATIWAFPTAGLSDADVKTTIDSLNERFNPVAVFVRFGFVIAVVEHDAEVPLDTSEIDARFQAKLLQSQDRAYGAYSANSGNNNAYGSSNGFGNNPTPSLGSSANSGANRISQDLRDYEEEISDAREKNKAQSRRVVLPRIRNRFANQASEADAAKFMRGLKLTDGAAITMVARNLDSLDSVFESNQSGRPASSPFAGLGLGDASPKKDASDSSGIFDSLKEKLDEQDPDAGASCVTVSVSLVGSPRVVAFMNFASENEAKSCEKSVNLLLSATKPLVLKSIQDNLVESGSDLAKVDLSPIVNAIFDGLKPHVSGSDVAVVLNLEPIKANAAAFMPLLGGVESKSQQEMESEEIDWSLGEKKNDESSKDLDGLFDNEDQPNDAENSADESDDPFGGDNDEEQPAEEDEEDPFA